VQLGEAQPLTVLAKQNRSFESQCFAAILRFQRKCAPLFPQTIINEICDAYAIGKSVQI
jgi:hypothetical protein